MTRRPIPPMNSIMPGGADSLWGPSVSGRPESWTRTEIPSPLEYEEPTFWKRSSVRRILGGFLALLLVMTLGVVGYVLLGWNAFDALYMVVITVSGVGFGEVRPMVSAWTRVHTMLVIAFGLLAVAYTLAGFVQFITEGEIQQLLGHKRVKRHIETLTDHVIIAGFGRMGSLICEELASAGEPFVLVERSPEAAGDFERRGYLYIIGNATEEKVLLDAGLNRAKALVSVVPTDAENVFITLTARELVPNVQIVARAEHPSTQKKLLQAGANHVVLPAAIGAHRITSLLTNPSAVEFVELVTKRSTLAIEMDEFPLEAASLLSGRTLRDADIGRRTGVIVIAIKRATGLVEFPPAGDDPFVQGDTIVVVGRRSHLDQFRLQFCAIEARAPFGRAPNRPNLVGREAGSRRWQEAPSAWRIGSSCGPFYDRISSAPPSGRRASKSRRRGGCSRDRAGTRARHERYPETPRQPGCACRCPARSRRHRFDPPSRWPPGRPAQCCADPARGNRHRLPGRWSGRGRFLRECVRGRPPSSAAPCPR